MKMKTTTREPDTPKMSEDFERFAKALMAVPKKEVDKELAKYERGKQQDRKQRKRA